MKTALALFGTLVAVASLPFSLAAAQENDSAVRDPDAYAVYASLVPQLYPVKIAPKETVRLQKETETWPKRANPQPENQQTCEPRAGAVPQEWRTVVESYAAENAKVRFLLPDQRPLQKYTVVPKSKLGTLEEWRFRVPSDSAGQFVPETRPSEISYLQLSAVGFNAAKTKAMVYAAFHCGNLCGGGRHYFLEKIDGAWRETRISGLALCDWVS